MTSVAKQGIFFLIFMLGFQNLAAELSVIPVQSTNPSTPLTPVQVLLALRREPAYQTCRDQLKVFASQLTGPDRNDLVHQQEQFAPAALEKLVKRIFKNKVSKIRFEMGLKGVVASISQTPHFICELSLFPDQVDPIKIHPVVQKGQTIQEFVVQRTPGGDQAFDGVLLGSSVNLEDLNDIHFDPSKARIILRQMGVTNERLQGRIIEELHQTEALEGKSNSPQPAKGKS